MAYALAFPERTAGLVLLSAPTHPGRGHQHACGLGLEGVIAGPYRSGRSTDWIKVLNPNAPAVIRLLDEE